MIHFTYAQIDDNYLSYYNDLFNFEISIPSDWNEEKGDNYVLFTPSLDNFNNFSESFIVYSYNIDDLPYFTNENNSYNDVINGELDHLKLFYNDFTLIKSPETISINYYNFSFFEFSYYDYLFGKINVKEYLLINDTNLFILSYQDKPLSYFSNLKMYDNIIQSFRIVETKNNTFDLSNVREKLSENIPKTYTNLVAGLKLDYPSNWEIEEEKVYDSTYKYYPYSSTLILHPPITSKTLDVFQTYINITIRNNYDIDHITEYNLSKSKMIQDKFHYNIIN